MIDPDAGAVLDGDAIIVHNLANRKVAEDDIGCVGNCDACTSDLGALTNTDDRL